MEQLSICKLFNKNKSQGGVENKNTRRIGVLICSSRNAFFKEVRRGISDTIKGYAGFGIELIVEVRSGEAVLSQVEAVRYMMKSGINALIITPISDPALLSYLEIISEKIPVITLNRQLDGFKRICHVGCDYISGGRAAAKMLGLFSGGVGNVAIFTESIKMSSLNKRIQGFSKLLEEEYPDYNILDIIQTSSKEKDSYEKALDFLRDKSKNVTAVLVVSEGSDIVLKAIKDSAFDGNVVAFSLDDKIHDYLEDGTVEAAVSQNPYQQGTKAAKIICDYLLEQKLPTQEIIIVSNQIYIKETINKEDL